MCLVKRITVSNTNVLSTGEMPDDQMQLAWDFPEGYIIPPGGRLLVTIEDLPDEPPAEDTEPEPEE